MYLLVLFVWAVIASADIEWNTSLLHSPIITNTTNVEELKKLNLIHIGTNTCILYVRGGTTPHSHDVWRHPRNPFSRRDGPKHKGTTVWINEWMTVGHGLYDSILLQILAATHVDRIVLQLSSHDVDHLGDGLGTWEMWFKNLYALMIASAQPGIPIYIRFREPHPHVAHFLSIDEHTGVVTDRVDSSNTLNIWQGADYFCGDRIITRNHDSAYDWHGENAFSPEAMTNFRKWAYFLPKHIEPAAAPLIHHFPANGPIVIAHHFRHQHAARHMENVDLLKEALLTAFPSPKYEVRSIATTEQSSAKGAIKQILDTAQAQVWITEHGATQSNLLYLRNGSFLLDMRGSYFKDEAGHISMVRSVCRAAGVFFDYTYTSNLKTHEQQSFKILESEVEEVIRKVRSYLKSQVFAFNFK
jgi:hypothetical protein